MILCRATKGNATTWWRWRLIDNKKCWYEGQAQIPKKDLGWEIVGPRRYYAAVELEAALAPPQAVVVPVPSPVVDWDPTRVDSAFQALSTRVVLPNPMTPLASHRTPVWADLWIVAAMAGVILLTYTLTLVFRNLGRLS